MGRSPIALRVIGLVVVSIGIGMIAVGFVKDADPLTFLGVFLVMVPFFACFYIESRRKQHKSPEDV